jgi:hypothetical protein
VSAELDYWFPSRGPCLVCGVPGADARHRVLDAIIEHASLGETAQEIARELDLPPEAVEVAIAEWEPGG